jgi:predicted RNA-binding Zn-ribbon protein involved in translation (DUF1610 family)
MFSKDIIIRNSARCLECGQEIVSEHRHDFKSCRCGNVSVDGGTAYIRRLFSGKGRWQDTSITMPREGADDVK